MHNTNEGHIPPQYYLRYNQYKQYKLYIVFILEKNFCSLGKKGSMSRYFWSVFPNPFKICIIEKISYVCFYKGNAESSPVFKSRSSEYWCNFIKSVKRNSLLFMVILERHFYNISISSCATLSSNS